MKRITGTLAAAVLLSLIPTAVAQAGYSLHDVDRVKAYSTNGKAVVSGHIKWYESGGFFGIHRGDYTSRTAVYAKKPVQCIWAKVTYGYPNGSFTVGTDGAGGSISGGSYDGNGLWHSCRKRGHRKPGRLSLAGVGYAKRMLNSSTVMVCTSRRYRHGPRYCSWDKNYYGD